MVVLLVVISAIILSFIRLLYPLAICEAVLIYYYSAKVAGIEFKEE